MRICNRTRGRAAEAACYIDEESHRGGPVAQLGARFHGMEEVVSSNLTRSTKTSQNTSEVDSRAIVMALTDRIIVDPNILTGKPVVRGTRISVELVVELLAAGWTHEQILASYAHVSEEDIRACLAYASELLREEKVYPLKTA